MDPRRNTVVSDGPNKFDRLGFDKWDGTQRVSLGSLSTPVRKGTEEGGVTETTKGCTGTCYTIRSKDPFDTHCELKRKFT